MQGKETKLANFLKNNYFLFLAKNLACLDLLSIEKIFRMPNKCTLYTFSEILMGQYFWANIKILLIGVDKEKFMIHNENVINSVDKTLIANHLQKKDKKNESKQSSLS